MEEIKHIGSRPVWPLNRVGLRLVEPRRTRKVAVGIWDGFDPSGNPKYQTAFTQEPDLYR